MKVLVAGDSRGALAAVRALFAAGCKVGVASPARGLAAASRWCADWHEVPPPEAGWAAYAMGIAECGLYDVVLPAGDAEAVALSAYRDSLPFRVPYGTHESVLAVTDKLVVTEAAAAAGLAVPATFLATDGLTGPVVVKARGYAEHGRAPVVSCAGAAAAARHVAALRAAGHEPVVQEHCRGDLVAVSVVIGPGGDTLGVVQQRTQRTWPVPAGISARAITVAPDRALVDGVVGMLRALGWSGLAQAQFLDDHSGPPRLIDVNGRLYGSLALAVAAGVNLPALWARGGEVAVGRPGVRYQWLYGDLRQALARRRPVDLAVALALAPRSAHSVWSRGDSRPALAYARELLWRRG